MTPEERRLIQNVGNVILQQIFSIAAFYFIYGLSAPIFPWSIRFLIKRKSWFQLTIVSLGLGASIVSLGILMTEAVNLVNIIASDTTLPLGDRIASYNSTVDQQGTVSAWIDTFAPLANDYFIVWRAWFLIHRVKSRRWALFVLGSLCLVYFASSVVSAVMTTISLAQPSAQINSGSKVVAVIADVAPVMSLVTNCAATAFNWWILRGHLKTLRENKTLAGQKIFNVWRILALLVETGAVYGVIQLSGLVLGFTTSADDSAEFLAFQVIQSMYYAFCFVYPALTFYIIHGPFSIVVTHDSVMSLDLASQERPSQDLA